MAEEEEEEDAMEVLEEERSEMAPTPSSSLELSLAGLPKDFMTGELIHLYDELEKGLFDLTDIGKLDCLSRTETDTNRPDNA